MQLAERELVTFGESLDRRHESRWEPAAPPVHLELSVIGAPKYLTRASPRTQEVKSEDSMDKHPPNPEPQIVAPKPDGVPVAVGQAEDLRAAAPGAATDNTASAI